MTRMTFQASAAPNDVTSRTLIKHRPNVVTRLRTPSAPHAGPTWLENCYAMISAQPALGASGSNSNDQSNAIKFIVTSKRNIGGSYDKIHKRVIVGRACASASPRPCELHLYRTRCTRPRSLLKSRTKRFPAPVNVACASRPISRPPLSWSAAAGSTNDV
ncbi:hypothetical protein EVAR_57548_1 [Eumeta japonica]|uniref:Uncharacterized protein n=1 Tax=Eumeta variegata TaxID=151549 RepID=A0A4C1Y2V0_EUMVA|nr:hypothetical protein EVAR_57548_1 [Eumeta japonica]